MIGGSKYNRENYPRKCFWTHEKETRVRFNPGLSANRPSNNWAQGLSQRAPAEHSMASESSLHVDNDQSTMQADLNREAAFNASELEMMWTSTIWNFFYRFSWSYAILPWRFRACCTFISIGNMINKTAIIVFVASIFESAKNNSAHCLLFLCHSLTKSANKGVWFVFWWRLRYFREK